MFYNLNFSKVLSKIILLPTLNTYYKFYELKANCHDISDNLEIADNLEFSDNLEISDNLDIFWQFGISNTITYSPTTTWRVYIPPTNK